MILGEEVKPSLEDLVLEHYGTKGMKWGVRKKPKVSALDIRSARVEVETRRHDINLKANRLNDVTRPGSGASKSQITRATKDYSEAIRNLETSDAQINSLRYTNGEKAVLILLAGPFAALPIGAVAASRAVARKQVEKARATGK